MLQAATFLREHDDTATPFEDYSIFLYRQNAADFTDRVKELEQKLLFPVRESVCLDGVDLKCRNSQANKRAND